MSHSVLVSAPPVKASTLQRTEPFDTGKECVCGNCNGRFLSWYILEGKPGREERKAVDEAYCSECGCRIEKGILQPCAQYEDPRTGIRFHQAPAEQTVGWVQFENIALSRLMAWFPGEYAQTNKMRPVLEEIDLFVRLRELFPSASLDRLIQARKSMRPFICSCCGELVDWRITSDWERKKVVQETYLLSMDEAF